MRKLILFITFCVLLGGVNAQQLALQDTTNNDLLVVTTIGGGPMNPVNQNLVAMVKFYDDTTHYYSRHDLSSYMVPKQDNIGLYPYVWTFLGDTSCNMTVYEAVGMAVILGIKSRPEYQDWQLYIIP